MALIAHILRSRAAYTPRLALPPPSAHPPLPRQPTMHQWLYRERQTWWRRAWRRLKKAIT